MDRARGPGEGSDEHRDGGNEGGKLGLCWELLERVGWEPAVFIDLGEGF